MQYENQLELMVYGRYALFSDPITRLGGEKCSYQVPTYDALKGVMESIYWKPTFIWVIDDVRVMNQIRTENKNIRPINYTGRNTLSVYTYLYSPCYQIRARRGQALPDSKACAEKGRKAGHFPRNERVSGIRRTLRTRRGRGLL